MEKKKIYLSNSDKKLMGVCGGIAEYFNIDSTIVRLLWILCAFAVGTGLLAYIICAFVIPNPPVNEAKVIKEKENKKN